MVRLIKRYGGGSRKLYDTEESRYVGLDEVAGFVRRGYQLRVEDSTTGEDVTAQTLAQVILEGERRGFSFLTPEFLHEAVRKGGKALSRQVQALQHGVDRTLRGAVDRLPAVRSMKGELDQLKAGLESLERQVKDLERPRGNGSKKSLKKRRKR